MSMNDLFIVTMLVIDLFLTLPIVHYIVGVKREGMILKDSALSLIGLQLMLYAVGFAFTMLLMSNPRYINLFISY